MSSLQKALKESKKGDSEGNKQSKKGTKTFTPIIRTVDADSSSDDDSASSDDSSVNSDRKQRKRESEEMIKIRQQAINLINSPSTGPNSEKYNSPYQQQSAGQRSAGQNLYTSPSMGSSPQVASYHSSNPHSMHSPSAHPRARTAEDLSMKDMFVNCVSEVCKSSSSELLHKVLSAGYKSVSNYNDPPVSGTWGDSIDTSQHGYGNGNRRNCGNGGVGNMPSRYQD
ncbi:unnamed protein product [Pseudo-nitzschia multistriata]|uniref:Uncharacterized protein n=1 Tax=Pseudo-nitzschia multistriata TaxID=183589 RepID=A0A448YUY2_9STRA|nr:unnamed protein product [Pseudo-nitzschia multistriata]